MKHILSNSVLAVLAGAFALTVVHAGTSPLTDVRDTTSAADRQVDRSARVDDADTSGESPPHGDFADTPHGVDPIVTGPASDSFRAQQRAAGCDEAEWPNIPALCYPG